MRWAHLWPLALAAGCATAPPHAPVPVPPVEEDRVEAHPPTIEDSSGPAVVALLGQADAELGSGSSQRAMAKLENALRIESRNPFVWNRLAAAHLAENRPAQAESMARRSISLARGNPWLVLENWRLIAQARRAATDEAGAMEAEGKVSELEAQLAK